MTEEERLLGLLTLADYKNDESLWERVRIRRAGKEVLSFRVRPLDEQEINDIRRECVRRLPNPLGRDYPALEGECDMVRLRSLKIVCATVEEDRRALWENGALQRGLNVMRACDTVDTLLTAGEKDAVIARIDRISGYGTDTGEEIKN